MKFILAILPLFFQLVLSAKNKDLYCDACKAIISEIEHGVSKVDPNKKIDVGGFRITPDGKTRTTKKSYARSETHLTDLLESVCKEVSDNYVESKDPETGKKVLKRIVTHDGKMSSDIDFTQLMEDSKQQNADTPPDAKTKDVKYACEAIVEDYEDEILHHFKKDLPDISMKICSEVAEYCGSEESKDEL